LPVGRQDCRYPRSRADPGFAGVAICPKFT
jgi:hypothetical protein